VLRARITIAAVLVEQQCTDSILGLRWQNNTQSNPEIDFVGCARSRAGFEATQQAHLTDKQWCVSNQGSETTGGVLGSVLRST
jgi:hypothetical protein